VEDIRFFEDEKKVLNDNFQHVLASHPLLSSYANVVSIMFQALKKVGKVAGVVTYSWKSYLRIVDSVLEKIMRELFIKMQGQKLAGQTQSSTSIVIDARGRLAVRSSKNLHES